MVKESSSTVQVDELYLEENDALSVAVTSAFDTAVHLPTVHRLERYWQEHGASIRTYEFPKDLKVWHDMIDPASPTEQIAVTYPKVIEMITT